MDDELKVMLSAIQKGQEFIKAELSELKQNQLRIEQKMDENFDYLQRQFQFRESLLDEYEPPFDKPVATHRSAEFDNEDWYNGLLDLIYEPINN